MLDAIIVGGGPAGSSAALVLARCRRRVALFDDGHPRNHAAERAHNVLTRDGTPPRELLRLAHEELSAYGVELVRARVTHARCCAPGHGDQRTGFEVTLSNGQTFRARKMLLATGVRDVLPDIPGFQRFYGKGVHHCPYCDGYEYNDRCMVAFGEGADAVGLAMSLRTWSPMVTACTQRAPLDDEQRERLERNGIGLREQRVVALEGGDRLERVAFDSGPPLECAALFFNTSQLQQSHLPAMLGCEFTDAGKVVTQSHQHTCVSGLYLAGDADGDVQFWIVAAAEGATAAASINRHLQDEDRGEAQMIKDAWRFRDP